MKMKLLKYGIVLSVVSSCLLVGCAKPQETATTTPTPTPEATKAPTPTPTFGEPEVVEMPEGIEGTYYEKIAGRGVMEVKKVNAQEVDITVDWSSSAFESSHWDIHAIYDPKNNRLVYEDVVKTDFVSKEDNTNETHEDYNDGKGYFEVGKGQLTWYDEKVEGEPSVFLTEEARATEMGLANPWIETEDLQEAIQFSGVKLDPPVDAALPEQMNFWKYRAMEGTIEVLYESVNDELIVRKSNNTQEEDISGDYNNYSKTWDLTLKGLTLQCSGDGESINKALFSAGDYRYSINMNPGAEGRGLTADQVNSLVNGMQ